VVKKYSSVELHQKKGHCDYSREFGSLSTTAVVYEFVYEYCNLKLNVLILW